MEKQYKDLMVPITHSKDSTEKEEILSYEKMNKLYSNWTLNKKENDMNKSNNIYKLLTLQDCISDLPLNYDEPTSFLNHTGSQCKVKIKNSMGNRATSWDKYAPTIMGRGSGTGGPLIPPHPEQHRRLSIREVARIQTFPDDFKFIGSNSACYRQIGNAVPVLMAYNIAKILPI